MSTQEPASKKVCSDLEWKEEVDAAERMKRKAAARRDIKAAEKSKKKEDKKASSSHSDGKKEKKKQNGAGSSSKSKGMSTKQSIKKVREKRRIQLKEEAEEDERKRARKSGTPALENHPGNIIVADPVGESAANPEDFFWEVETVIGRRVHRGRVEYLIRWKGCSEDDNTWEPALNLCDTAMEEAMRYVKRQKLKEKMREEEEKKLFGEPDIDATSNPNGIVANDKNILDDNEKVKGEQNTMHGKNDDLKDADAPMQDVYHHDDHDIECNDAVIYEDDDMWKWSDKDQVDFRELERIDVNDCNATKRVKEARINGTPVVLVGHVGWANFAKRWLRQREVVGKKETGNTPLAAASADSAVETRTTPTNGDTKQSCKCDDSGIIHQGDKCVTPDLANTAESPVTQENATVEMVDAGTVDNEIEVKKDELKTTHQGGARLEGGSNAPVVAKGDESQTTDVDKISACDAVLKQKEDKPSSTIEEENQEIATVEMADAGTVDNTIEEKKDELNTTHQGVAGFEGESNAPAVAKVDESKSADIGKTSAGDAAQTPKDHEPNSIIEKENTSTKGDSNELLNLSGETYELDVEKMIQDIGDEDVPVIKRNYNEEKPIHGRIPASKFLTNCWPNSDNSNNTQQNGAAKNQKTPPKLYLHQWQFPLSDTAGRKLCHQNNPLPKEIMGEDLLKYWIDLPQCKLDSPLQYIFMGREDTLSKLHRDPGGLDISIAPIVGHKECVLVHRSDGSNCLYHLTASLDDIDLHRFPLMSQARIWRSVIKPGEILLMPQGTYHQCRNLTPCLSYSRFHLDTVNLLPFVQSLVNGDAPEIDHDDVLWNLTSELIKKVDTVFDETQSRVKKGLATKDLVTDGVIDTVNTLRTLRHFVREVARREEVRQVVKGSSTSNATKPKGQVLDKGVTKTTIATKQNSEDHNFTMLVDDLDMCLHEFRYRHMKQVPQFKPRKGKALKNTLSGSSGGRTNVIKRDLSKFGIGGRPVVAFNTALENNYMSLKDADIAKNYPNAAKANIGISLIGKLAPEDKIVVKLEQKHVKAEVVEIIPQMKSAYLTFEDYPSLYDEFQPCDLIRLPSGAEIPPEDMKPGLVVIDISNSNEYRAVIQSIVTGPMVRVKHFVSQHSMTRLVSPAMILGRYVPKTKTKQPKTKESPLEIIDTDDEEPPPMRPTKVGQMVEVDTRAGRVTRVYPGLTSEETQDGEPAPTHVDVCFILGNAITEKKIPISDVRLAPELDPNSGRGSRHTAKLLSPSNKDELGNDGTPNEGKLAANHGIISPAKTNAIVLPGASA